MIPRKCTSQRKHMLLRKSRNLPKRRRK
jgi:hypothetical protein